jgi:putative glutamine amidotransferase
MCDGFLFTGGVDLHPSKYGETIQFDSVSVDEHRDAFEEGLFAAVYPTRKPILGICRGIQSINVWLGGSLHQHIDGHRQEPHRVNRTHPITIYEGSMLHAICGKTSVMVNSAHHQVLKDVASQLVVDAVSPEGYVEAAHQPDHPFLFAVQFHPEAYYHTEEDDHAAAIFKAFVDACGV